MSNPSHLTCIKYMYNKWINKAIYIIKYLQCFSGRTGKNAESAVVLGLRLSWFGGQRSSGASPPPSFLLLRHLDEKLPLGLAVAVQLKAVFALDRLRLLPRTWVLPPVEDSGRHGEQRHGHKDHCCDHTWGGGGRYRTHHSGYKIQDSGYKIFDYASIIPFGGVSTFRRLKK